MSEELVIGDLRFRLRRGAERETVGVTVERDGSLTVRAPEGVSRERVEEVARERQFWVYRKLAEKKRLAGPPREKEFVSGESFHYLGRCYRLRLFDPEGPDTAPLRLVGGEFLLRREEADRGWEHFTRWYSEHGRPWIAQKVERYAPRIGVEPVPVEVRDLGYRWGSCSVHRRLNFHWRTALLPPRIIEYIVVHELVHLVVPDHSDEFWRRVERALPDYAARRRWLREEGGGYGKGAAA